jgi:ABC-type Na+ efflux pump permease subunit
MAPARFDPERYTPYVATLGVATLAASFHWWWLLPVSLGLFALACLADTRKLYLFGPFLNHELLRMTRRVRNHLWRPLLAAVAGVPLLIFYYVLTERPPDDRPHPDDVANIATGGFLFVFWVLFITTLATTAQYLTYAVAEDRESKRLDFQLVTDLRGRELVIGKMFARMLGLLTYPLAALPTVLLLPILFKVEPAVLLYAFAYGGATIASIAGLSGLGSVLAANKKAGGNVFAVAFLPYLFVVFVAAQLRYWPEVWFFPGSAAAPPAVSLGDVIDWVAVGNPLALMIKWTTLGIGGGSVTAIAADFPNYASFHVAVGGLCFLYAARMIRRAGANNAEVATPGQTKADAPPPPPRRPVDDEAVWWKEAFCHHVHAKARENPRSNRLAFFLLAVAPALLFLAASVSSLGGYREYFILDMARYAPMLVAWLAIMTMGRFGIESIARERDRDTLLTLVVTPLPPREIVRQKFWGLFRLMRGTLIWQLMIGVPAVLCGAYPWWAYPGVVLLQVEHMLVMAAFGLSISANAPSVEAAGKRFGLWAGVVGFVTIVGCAVLLAATGGPLSPFRYVLLTIVPPLSILAVGHTHLAAPHDLPLWVAGFAGGVLIYAALGWWHWNRAVARFVAATDPSAEKGPMFDGKAA